MDKEQKAAVVEEIAAQIQGAEAIFAIDYRGISVPQAAELRAKLREADATFRVVKNRLTRLAAEKAGREQLNDLLDGPTALTFVEGDLALAAKAISTLNRDWDVLEFKGGLMDGDVLEPDEFAAIARLPGRDALNAQFAGMVASPLTGLVRGLNALIAGLAIQLRQIEEQGLVEGEPPAEEGAPAEEPAAEVPAEEDAPAEEPAAEAPAQEESPAEEDAPAEEPPAEEAVPEEDEGAPAQEDPEQAPADQPAEDEPAEEEPAAEDTSDDTEEESE